VAGFPGPSHAAGEIQAGPDAAEYPGVYPSTNLAGADGFAEYVLVHPQQFIGVVQIEATVRVPHQAQGKLDDTVFRTGEFVEGGGDDNRSARARQVDDVRLSSSALHGRQGNGTFRTGYGITATF
jgi:hypothetical protein